MKIERTKSATRNMFSGWILQIYNMILPFIVRTAMIYIMGVEYLGLNSLFISIITVLNLAELGVGSAMVYSMYKPIAEDDHEKICKLMNLYKKYYRIIGLVIGTLGLILLPFLPKLIQSDIPADVNIYILYILNLAATVCTYWLFAYKNSLLYAFQKNHIESKVNMAVNTIKTILQLAILYLTRNYYTYLVIAIIFQIVSNLVIAAITTKLFPQYKASGKLDKKEVAEINKRIRDLFTATLGTMFVNQVDTIVISAFLGLTSLAIYQNYFYILSSVRNIITVALKACVAGIGNSIIVESEEKNLNDLKKLTFIISWISGWCVCCFLGLYQPFMEIWMGKDLMLGFGAVICFAVYFFVMEINQLLSIYKEAAGIWHEDRFRPLVTAVVNLTLNLILVRFWGLYGIILSTVFSTLFIGLPWLLNNLFTVIFNRANLKPYMKKLGEYVVITFLAAIFCVGICSFIDYGKWLTLLLRLIVCCIIPNVIYIICYLKKNEFIETLDLFNVITKGKFHLDKIKFKLLKKAQKN